jgi:hypothetical protein
MVTTAATTLTMLPAGCVICGKGFCFFFLVLIAG